MKPNELESQALKLTPRKRARLAHKLLLSLDTLSEAEIEQLWIQEAAQREAEIDSGKVKLIPAEKAFRQARQRLQ